MTAWLVLAVHTIFTSTAEVLLNKSVQILKKKKKLHLSAVNCNEEGGRACTNLYCFELSCETLRGTTRAHIFSWLLHVTSVVV